jgi:hypothetical protein
MDSLTYKILADLDKRPRRLFGTFLRDSDAVEALYPDERGLYDAGLLHICRDRPGGDLFLFVSVLGRKELERRRHIVRRWFLKRLDTILTAAVTAVAVSVATAWVTAHFAAAKEMARRTGDAECRDGRNADDGQPLAEAHYANAVPIAAVQQQRAE